MKLFGLYDIIVKYLVLNYLLGKKEHERPRKRYSPKVITKQVKSLKYIQKHQKDNNTSNVEPTCDLTNEPTRQRTKLFVSDDYFEKLWTKIMVCI